jgi:hypothetical protein
LGLWMVYRLARMCLIERFEQDPGLEERWRGESRMGETKGLVGLMVGMLREVAELVLGVEWERVAKRLVGRKESGKGRDGKGKGKRRGKEGMPPPYVGPEEPPEGLPSYGEIEIDEKAGVGLFEGMVAGTVEEMINGDGKMFWDEYMKGVGPDDGYMKMGIGAKITEIMKEEERYAQSELEAGS